MDFGRCVGGTNMFRLFFLGCIAKAMRGWMECGVDGLQDALFVKA